jgi:tRNA (Thr-GGU) A37 N-methylase
MADSNEMVARPIGRVVSGRPWPPGDDNWEGRASEIEIGPDWAPALEGIEEFSHIWLVWWFNRHPDPPESTHVHPEGRADMPRVGLFASRSPRRPNPIAMTAVRLLERNGDRLKV